MHGDVGGHVALKFVHNLNLIHCDLKPLWPLERERFPSLVSEESPFVRFPPIGYAHRSTAAPSKIIPPAEKIPIFPPRRGTTDGTKWACVCFVMTSNLIPDVAPETASLSCRDILAYPPISFHPTHSPHTRHQEPGAGEHPHQKLQPV